MNKWMGISIFALALVIGIVPLFTDCQSQGRSLTTTTGMSVPMKCHWTAIAEMGLAIPLALVGLLNITSKRKETLRVLNIFGPVLGALAILFPVVLIGVCSNPDMICNLIMKPAMILAGTLVIISSLVVQAKTAKMQEQAG